MAGTLADTAENAILTAMTGGTAFSITSPVKVRLVTSVPSDSVSGTELVGGSYIAQNVTSWTTPVQGRRANGNTITFTNLPAATIYGIELWDSAGSPLRLAYFVFTTPRPTVSGDEISFAIGALTVNLT